VRHTFQERIAPKSLEIDQVDNLRKKFSELNIDFNGPSLDPVCSRPAHEGIKEERLFKMRSLARQMVADA